MHTTIVPLPNTEHLAKKKYSYDHVRLREDAAEAWGKVVRTVVLAGGIVTSGGGLRSLHSRPNKWRSKRSLHTLGRAVDLGVPTGAYDPKTDCFFVERDDHEKRLWRVWARVNDGEERELNIIAARLAGCEGIIEARVLDFTALCAEHGFERIPAREDSWDKPIGEYGAGSEWWHFQYALGLRAGVTTYGEELQKIWTLDQLKGTLPWGERDALYRKGWG